MAVSLDPLFNTGYGPAAAQGSYIAAGSAQPASSAQYNTQVPYLNPSQQIYYQQPAGSVTNSSITSPRAYVYPQQSELGGNESSLGGGGGADGGAVLGSSTGSGSGSQMSLREQMEKGLIPWNDNILNAQSNSGPDYAAIDNAYNEINAQINNLESQAGVINQDTMNYTSGQYEALKPGLEQSYISGVKNLDVTKQGTQTEGESAMDAARRMAQELKQGVRARFGGSNSAGEFAEHFYNREAQRQVGNLQNTLGQNLFKIQTAKDNLYSEWQSKLKELDLMKTNALSQAKIAFDNALQQINAMRVESAQNKAQAKLTELQNYRARVQQVEDSAVNYQRQIQAQVLSGFQNLASAVEAYKVQSGQTPSMSGYANTVMPYVQQFGRTVPTTQVTGYTGKKDEYGH
jgi:hypothetical protein